MGVPVYCVTLCPVSTFANSGHRHTLPNVFKYDVHELEVHHSRVFKLHRGISLSRKSQMIATRRAEELLRAVTINTIVDV